MNEEKQGLPQPNPMLLKQATIIITNLVQFPCQIVLFNDKENVFHGYRIEPDLKMVELNITIYSYLKEFAIWYLQAHQQSSGIHKLKLFTELVTAIYDFGLYWRQFAAFDPIRADVITQLCNQANRAASADIAADIERKKAGN